MLLSRLNCFFCPCDGFNFSVFKTKLRPNICLGRLSLAAATVQCINWTPISDCRCFASSVCISWGLQENKKSLALIVLALVYSPYPYELSQLWTVANAAGLGMFSNQESGGHRGNRHPLELKGIWGCFICLDSAFGQFYDPENHIEKYS